MTSNIKKYNSDFKLKIVLKYLSENHTMPQLCQEYNISLSSLKKWVKQFKENISLIFNDSLSNNGKQRKQDRATEREISNLYSKIGRLTMERDYLKKALDS